jgi:hypothetical protein
MTKQFRPGGDLTIDHQAHWYPRALLETLAGREGCPTLERTDVGYTLLHPPAGRWRQPITSLFLELDQHFAPMASTRCSRAPR